jgi:hypothetical protein
MLCMHCIIEVFSFRHRLTANSNLVRAAVLQHSNLLTLAHGVVSSLAVRFLSAIPY